MLLAQSAVLKTMKSYFFLIQSDRKLRMRVKRLLHYGINIKLTFKFLSLLSQYFDIEMFSYLFFFYIFLIAAFGVVFHILFVFKYLCIGVLMFDCKILEQTTDFLPNGLS